MLRNARCSRTGGRTSSRLKKNARLWFVSSDHPCGLLVLVSSDIATVDSTSAVDTSIGVSASSALISMQSSSLAPFSSAFNVSFLTVA
jgi:hypothetical protein